MADFAVTRKAARAEIRKGLLSDPPSISPKYFYDRVGSDLFERITRTPEYYLTATEIGILEGNLEEITARIGPRAVLAEIAAGSARKARIVLGGLETPAAYAPVDIAGEMLAGQAAAVRRDFPDLRVIPVRGLLDASPSGVEFRPRRVSRSLRGSSLGLRAGEGVGVPARSRSPGPGSASCWGGPEEGQATSTAPTTTRAD